MLIKNCMHEMLQRTCMHHFCSISSTPWAVHNSQYCQAKCNSLCTLNSCTETWLSIYAYKKSNNQRHVLSVCRQLYHCCHAHSSSCHWFLSITCAVFTHNCNLIKELMFIVFAGNWITAAAHIVTAVIGSGVLSLAWAISTMGWVAGPIILFLFAAVTWYMSLLLADAYRNPRDTGKRNYTYPGAVSAILGKCCSRS